jgi:hypothetical protein
MPQASPAGAAATGSWLTGRTSCIGMAGATAITLASLARVASCGRARVSISARTPACAGTPAVRAPGPKGPRVTLAVLFRTM